VAYKEKKKYKSKKLFLFVGRFSTEGKPLISKPCSVCLQNIKNLGIIKVGYFNEKGETIVENVNNIKSELSDGTKTMLNNCC
jgi:hypothetical protein